MNIHGNTILITGGATGIGFALAEAFLKEDNTVIVCSRKEDRLTQAQQKLPQLQIKQCDISKEKEMESLHQWVTKNYSDINILVNNAGIQRMIDFRKGTADLFKYRAIDDEDEITINFKAYVYMASYFIPDLMKKKDAAVINVSSGLGFIPLAIVPVYCATKAAIHSFSVSLRHQLKNTPIKVFEIIPPTVDTNLDQGARDQRRQADRGIPPGDVAKATIAGLEKDEYEIAIGMAQGLKNGSRTNFDQIFANMNR